MSLMSALYVGASGLQTSQNALNTTAHNMSNLDTTGYTRQQVMQGERQYNTTERNPVASAYKQFGLGVNYSKVRQVRDSFLDSTYRRESGRSAFYSTSYNAMTEVQTILGEVYGATFNNNMENLQRSIDELAKTPSDSVVQSLVVQRASAFLESAQAVYKGLSDYQNNLNFSIGQKVKTINNYGKKIHDLNTAIVRAEAAGLENANDLRDSRNQLLDELGSMARISYKEDMAGNVTVRLEDHDFVSKDLVYEIGLEEDDETGFYTPFWYVDANYTIDSSGKKRYDTDGAEVFNLQQTISTELNTDIGEVKALLLARGDRRADYTDLQDKDAYNRDIAQSIIMNIQAEFDQLIHNVTTRINQVLAGAADTKKGYLCEEVMVDGKVTYQPIQLFQKRVGEGYSYGLYTDEGGNRREGWIYNEESFDEKESLYSVMNMIINPALIKEPTKLGFVNGQDEEDRVTASALAKTFQEAVYMLNPNVNTPLNFPDYYSGLVAQIANSGSVYREIAEYQADAVEATCAAREQIVGVSSDEELTNMIKFQNAYNASSRYINVISEMIEHIISTLGR